MNYNPHTPIAVFLGPSLERSQAAQILTANYYPPVRMGDIYRLIGSGVRIIVLIDGIFHSEASVWQREILEALTNDITVIGASSIGALRAAELHAFGMVGYGRIFEWYRDGVIDGDDEVALIHGDASNGFRPLSEPLVNIRYNLMEAVRRTYISQAQGAALIESAKGQFYAERCYSLLLDSPVVKRWSQKTRNRLVKFISENTINLKKKDAISALKHCAAIVTEKGNHQTASLPSSVIRNPYHQLASYLNRGFLHPGGYLINGKDLLDEIYQDANLVNQLRTVLTNNYFLLLWARQNNIKYSRDYFENFKQKWQNEYIKSDYCHWLRANGLTEREFESAMAERALLAWLLEQGPEHFGLDFKPYVQFWEALLSFDRDRENNTTVPVLDYPKSNGSPMHAGLLKRASEICYLTAWAKENGITCPPAEVGKCLGKWEKTKQVHNRGIWLRARNISEKNYSAVLSNFALYDWLIKKGPKYFGYVFWSFEVALLKELQITGQVAQIVERTQRFSNHGIAYTNLYTRYTPSDST